MKENEIKTVEAQGAEIADKKRTKTGEQFMRKQLGL